MRREMVKRERGQTTIKRAREKEKEREREQEREREGGKTFRQKHCYGQQLVALEMLAFVVICTQGTTLKYRYFTVSFAKRHHAFHETGCEIEVGREECVRV